jgi:hypothetical protein
MTYRRAKRGNPTEKNRQRFSLLKHEQRHRVMHGERIPQLTPQWYNGKIYWMAWTDTECLVVDPAIYDRVVTEELAKQGIERKSYTQYMEQATAAWMRQRVIEMELEGNLPFWKQVPGVVIYSEKGSNSETNTTGE